MKFNNLYIILVLLSLILLNSCFINDNSSPEPDDVFLKIYGGTGSETAVGLEVSPDRNSYYILGSSTSNPANNNRGTNDIYLIQTDVEGNLSNEVFINVNEGDSTEEVGLSMKLFDNEIAVVGSTQTINELGVFSEASIIYSFVDLELNLIRTDTIGFFSAFGQGINDFRGNDIVKTQDDNFVILATIGDPTGLNRDIALIKVNDQGDILWSRRFNIPGDDAGVSIIEFPDGDLGVCGETSRVSINGLLGQNTLFLVTSDIGLLRNSLAFGQTLDNNTLLNDIPTRMINDGAGVVIIGNSSIANQVTANFILSLSKNGSERDFPMTLFTDNAFSSRTLNDVKRALNGEFILTGKGVPFSEQVNEGLSDQVMFYRAEQSGETIFINNGFGDNNDSQGQVIYQLPDGDILIAATIGFGNANNKIGLFKVNGSGQLQE